MPERVVELFPGAVYENRFGTVAVRRDGEVFEITTFRTDHDYADFRRPHRVEFGDTIELDLARRDFTVNAMAWGARPGETPALVDPYDGPIGRGRAAAPRGRRPAAPVRGGRAPDGPRGPPRDHARLRDRGRDAGRDRGQARRSSRTCRASGSRPSSTSSSPRATPSVGLRLLSETGLLASISPELAAQRGVPQNKVPGEDLWDHTLRSVDAAPAARPIVRLAALLHDIGKPATFADGHFLGHDAVGAELAGAFLDRLRSPRAVRDRVVELVRQHMFSYESTWSDAAVRRFIGKMAAIGDGALDELLDLREADNVGIGAAGRGGPPGRAPGAGRRRARAPTSSSIGAGSRSTGPT